MGVAVDVGVGVGVENCPDVPVPVPVPPYRGSSGLDANGTAPRGRGPTVRIEKALSNSDTNNNLLVFFLIICPLPQNSLVSDRLNFIGTLARIWLKSWFSCCTGASISTLVVKPMEGQIFRSE